MKEEDEPILKKSREREREREREKEIFEKYREGLELCTCMKT